MGQQQQQQQQQKTPESHVFAKSRFQLSMMAIDTVMHAVFQAMSVCFLPGTVLVFYGMLFK